MNSTPDGIRGGRTELLSELENPDGVERSAGHKPGGRSKLKGSIKQWRKGTGASIDVFQQTSVTGWGD